MTIAYGDPFAELQGELERMLATAFGARGPAGGVYPPVNIFDRGAEFLIKAELPGLEADQIDVHVEGDVLTLRGERTIAAPGEEAAYHRRKRDDGRFRRVVQLPARVAPDTLRAEYRDGVLSVHVPKVKEVQPRRVQIQVG